jgi:hypothetical protein
MLTSEWLSGHHFEHVWKATTMVMVMMMMSSRTNDCSRTRIPFPACMMIIVVIIIVFCVEVKAAQIGFRAIHDELEVRSIQPTFKIWLIYDVVLVLCLVIFIYIMLAVCSNSDLVEPTVVFGRHLILKVLSITMINVNANNVV